MLAHGCPPVPVTVAEGLDLLLNLGYGRKAVGAVPGGLLQDEGAVCMVAQIVFALLTV